MTEKLILAFDPGITTGVAMVRLFDGLPVLDWTDQTDVLSTAEYIEEWWDIVDFIVVEEFGIGNKTHGASRGGVHIALNLIGYIKIKDLLTNGRTKTQVITQKPSMGKTIDDAMLNRIGWNEKEMVVGRHARDAVRHIVRFLLTSRNPHIVDWMTNGVGTN